MNSNVDADALRAAFSKNLKRLMTGSGKKISDLSNDLGVAYTTVADWYHGKKYPRMDKVQALSDYFGVAKSELTEESFPSNLIPLGDITPIPIVGRVAAGIPILAEENIVGYEYLPDVKKPHEYFCLIVKGDSMVNAGIPNGAKVLVHKQDFADDGQIAVCIVNGNEATLKRIRKAGDTVILMPENPAYQPIIVSCADFDSGYACICGVAEQVIITKPL